MRKNWSVLAFKLARVTSRLRLLLNFRLAPARGRPTACWKVARTSNSGTGKEVPGGGKKYSGTGNKFSGGGEEICGTGKKFSGGGEGNSGTGKDFSGSGERFPGSGERSKPLNFHFFECNLDWTFGCSSASRIGFAKTNNGIKVETRALAKGRYFEKVITEESPG